MFDMEYLMGTLSNKFSSENINKAVSDLVSKGILEQYTDEDGEFHFQLTKFGLECGEELFNNPKSFLESREEDEDDGGF